jgi:hypothetical protein
MVGSLSCLVETTSVQLIDGEVMVSELMAMEETKVELASNKSAKSGGMARELHLEDQIRDEFHPVLWAMQRSRPVGARSSQHLNGKTSA